MFFYEQFFGSLRMSGGYFQFQAPQLRVIPILEVNASQQRLFAKIVDQILLVKAEDPKADVHELESKIDKLIYKQYGLTTEEIELLEAGKF